MAETEISGTCSCGQLGFASKRPPVVQAICHCTDCRAATGEPFTLTAFFPSKHIAFRGDVAVRKFVAESGAVTSRESCPVCGSVMIDRSEGVPGLIGVVTRFIAPPFEPKPDCHMWLRSKLPDVDIDDGLVKYQERIKL